MSTLFAFLHHVAAFTLVSAIAVEFILVGQELSLATARRLTGMPSPVFGIACRTCWIRRDTDRSLRSTSRFASSR